MRVCTWGARGGTINKTNRWGLLLLLTAIAAMPAAGQAPPRAATPAGFERPRVHTIVGAHPGPRIAFVGGVHGGKVAASRALEQLATMLRTRRADLHGTVLIVPTVNLAGRRAGLAQLSPVDGLNLNRVFPGRADGRPTERLAHWILGNIVAKSNYLVDVHGSDGDDAVGSFAYAARPGVTPRVDSAALRLAYAWAPARIVWDDAGPRTLETSRFLQTAAHLSGVPAITVFESGHAREDTAATAAFVQHAMRTLVALGIIQEELGDDPGPLVHPRRAVALAESEGGWTPVLTVGATVSAGEPIGTLVRSSGESLRVVAPADGVILQHRLPGFAPAGAPLVILAADAGTARP